MLSKRIVCLVSITNIIALFSDPCILCTVKAYAKSKFANSLLLKLTTLPSSNVTLTLRAYGEKYKNQGRYKLLKENDFEGLQFDNTNFKPIPTKTAKPQLSVSIIVYTNEAPVVIGTNQTEGNVKWISYATPPYPTITMYQITSGTLRVGDYLICEGVNIPLEVKDIKRNKGSTSGSSSRTCP